MSVSNVDPSTLFGGTWVEWGSGRVPVGVNVSDSNFNVVEATGGSASSSATLSGTTDGHVLTIAEMPSHTHSIPYFSYGAGGGGSSAFALGPAGASTTLGYTGGNQAHSHTFSGVTANLPVLQPYITCYMWKRVE